MRAAAAFFWNRYPALSYGLAYFLGVSCFLSWSPVILLPIILLIISAGYASPARGLLACALFATGLSVAVETFDFPETILEDRCHEAKKVKALFKINSLKSSDSTFGERWIYSGILTSLGPEKKFKNIPATITLKKSKSVVRPAADKTYLVEGFLKKNPYGSYTFKIKNEDPWLCLGKSLSLAETRFHAKKSVASFIRGKIKDRKCATFLSGIATGNFEDKRMSFEFSRFGLQHIMAISGFHFSILAGMLGFALRLFVPFKWNAALLATLLTLYFLFLGTSPSVIRAWITILTTLAGCFFGRKALPLNTLGIALLTSLIYDPLACGSLGFQFSYAATAAILLFFPQFDRLLERLFYKRPLSIAIEMDIISQHGYILCVFLRQALALGIAVNLVALPLTLFNFGYFPLMALLFNIFFPILVAVPMFLLLLGFCLPFFTFIHDLNQEFTNFMLSLIYNMPKSLDYKIYAAALSSDLMIVYLTLLFSLGVFANHLHEVNKECDQELLFI